NASNNGAEGAAVLGSAEAVPLIRMSIGAGFSPLIGVQSRPLSALA
ncbi:MAG: hypothetical protein K0S21_3768, partial [Rhizobiaceae bacterium]|nr:hypothetical protein [Rhizobiaceae bacterium]